MLRPSNTLVLVRINLHFIKILRDISTKAQFHLLLGSYHINSVHFVIAKSNGKANVNESHFTGPRKLFHSISRRIGMWLGNKQLPMFRLTSTKYFIFNCIAKSSFEILKSNSIEIIVVLPLSSLLERVVYLRPGDPTITCAIRGGLVTGNSLELTHAFD